MKKTIILALALVMIMSLLVGCGSKTPTSSNDPSGTTTPSQNSGDNSETPSSQPTNNNGQAAGGIYTEAGMELQAFYNAFNENGMGVFEGEINDASDKDTLHMDLRGDALVPSQEIVLMAGLDFIESGDNPREEQINGENTNLREKSGNEITFSTKEVKTSSFGDTKEGDVLLMSGKLDTSTNTLTVEVKTERDGVVLSRSVSEVVMIADGSFISQTFVQDQKPEDDRIEYIGRAYFVKFDKANLELISATFPADVAFAYESIVGNKDATPESMSESYTRERKLNVVDGGEVTASEY